MLAAVAALTLGLIQCGVGLGAQGVGLLAGTQRAHTDADLDAGVGEAAAQPPREGASAARVGVRQQQRELVAPDPVGAVSGPGLAQDRGDALEHRDRREDARDDR